MAAKKNARGTIKSGPTRTKLQGGALKAAGGFVPIERKVNVKTVRRLDASSPKLSA